MKRLSYILLFAFGLLTACQDSFLELTDPSQYTTDAYYVNADQAQQAITASYASLQRRGVFQQFGVHIPDQLSDEFFATGFAAGYGTFGAITNLVVNSDDRFVRSVWNDLYQAVYTTNIAIDRIPTIVEIDQNFSAEDANELVAEAKFLRALYYFLLTQYFGEEIPLQTVPGEERYPAPASAGEIYSLIEADLKDAQSSLPLVDERRGTPFMGKATQGAATALLGKVYLFREQYDLAAAELAKVVNGEAGTYRLMDSYRDNFTQAMEHNDESVFEVNYTIIGGSPGSADWDNPNQDESEMYTLSRSVNRQTNSQYWFNFAIRRDRVNNGDPVLNFEEGDNRVYATFWGVEGGASYTGPEGETLAWNEQEWETVEGGCFGLRKYDQDDARNVRQNDTNLRVIRYADVLLMYAEALHQLGRSDEEVAQYIDQVRTRANNVFPDDQESVPSTTQPGTLVPVLDLMQQNGWDMMTAIEHERYVELFGEEKRWFDIRRWNIGDEALSYKPGWRGQASYFLPVPQSELDNNPNFNQGNMANQ